MPLFEMTFDLGPRRQLRRRISVKTGTARVLRRAAISVWRELAARGGYGQVRVRVRALEDAPPRHSAGDDIDLGDIP